MAINAQDRRWIVALAVACAGIAGYMALYSTNSISAPAYLAGFYFIYALVLWGVFRAVFLREHGKKAKRVAFAAVYLTLLLSGLRAASRQEEQTVKAVSSIQQEMNYLAAAVRDSGEFGVRTEWTRDPAPIASGEFGEMERFIKEYLQRVMAQRSDYLLELDAIGWGSILDAQRLKSDPALVKSKVILARARQIVDKYDYKNAELLQDTRARITTLDISASAKRAMLSGYDESMRDTGKRNGEQWNLERAGLDQVANIVALLTASKMWTVEGDELLFYSDKELAQFNSYIQAIEDITQRQNRIAENSIADANRRLEAMRTAAGK